MGLRHIRVEEIPGLVRHKNVYEPSPERQKLYERLYGAFLDLYKSNKALLARLNRPG